MNEMHEINPISKMTVFKVYPGVDLIYNKFNVSNFNIDTKEAENIMEISHCKKGRVECELKDGTYLYLGEGDLGINMIDNHANVMNFPVQYYEGISININFDDFQVHIPEILVNASFNIEKIKAKFCKHNGCFVMRATKQIEHIFLELYSIPDEIKEAYLKIKVIELLLFMSMLDESKSEKKESYYKHHIDTVKMIKEQITKNYERRYTIEELSKEHCISPTTLKTYFKEIYGVTINTYIKNYRMERAAKMLQETRKSIADVAYEVSYESQSKFAMTFKNVYGMSPLEYRKKCLVSTHDKIIMEDIN